MKQVFVLIVIGVLLLSACGASSNTAVGRLRAKTQQEQPAQQSQPEPTLMPSATPMATVAPMPTSEPVTRPEPFDEVTNFWALVILVGLGFALGWVTRTITLITNTNEAVKRG